MNKKRKFLNVMLSLTLALMLCFGLMTPALADEVSVEAALTKILQMPEGTDTPNYTFTFEVTKVSVDGETGTMPDLNSAGLTANVSGLSGATTGGIKTITVEAANLFAGVTWPHAGVYVYSITEAKPETPELGLEGVDYSPAVYTLTVYVKNTAAMNGPYVFSATVEVVTPDTVGQETDENDKVDPTPSEEGTGTGFVFTNTYIKEGGGTDPEEPDDRTLSISKTVVGAYGNLDKYFEFDVTIIASALKPGTTYIGYVIDDGDNIVTSTENGAKIGENYISFLSGESVKVYLKHGQSLVFIDTEVGAKYSVTESGMTNYKPSVAVLQGAVETVTPGSDEGVSLTALGKAGESNILIGAEENSAEFTNTHDDTTVTPTGILINNLPYIAILLLAVGALVVFVVVKSRKAKAYAGK